MLQSPSNVSVDRRCRAIVNAAVPWGLGENSEDTDRLWDILIDDAGVISAIVPSSPAESTEGTSVAEGAWDGEVLDAQGSLVLPGFVDAHVHLDKALLNSRCCAETGSFPEALTKTLEAKRGFTVADIRTRARRVIESAVAFGTTRMRSHAEVDPEVGLRAVEALLALKKDFAWALELQVAAFAQEGIADGGDLLRQALALGCDVVGSAPYCDKEPEANIRLIFDLAEEFKVGVDFHLDYHLGAEKPSYLGFVLAEAKRRRQPPEAVDGPVDHRSARGARVCLGHCTALSSLPAEELASVAAALRDADVAVLALPASDVYMMARADPADRRRGVAPVDRLATLGVKAAFATNNVQNLFTFTGDGDMLKVATLTAQMLQLGARHQHVELLRMATCGAAEAIALEGAGATPDLGDRQRRAHDCAVGCLADLVLLRGALTATDAVAAPPVRRVVLKRGRIVAETNATVELFPPVGSGE